MYPPVLVGFAGNILYIWKNLACPREWAYARRRCRRRSRESEEERTVVERKKTVVGRSRPRSPVLVKGWEKVCLSSIGGPQVPWPWLGCRWAQMGRRVVLISLLIIIPWKVETWFLAYKRRPAVYQCNISIPKIQRNNINAEQFKDMQMITKIPLLWMRMNEKEWIRNIYNAWVSSYHYLHASSSACQS